MAGENGYVVLVWSFPFEGVPSHRIYGDWPTRDETHRQATALQARQPELHIAVLPLRETETLKFETP